LPFIAASAYACSAVRSVGAVEAVRRGAICAGIREACACLTEVLGGVVELLGANLYGLKGGLDVVQGGKVPLDLVVCGRH